MSTPVPSSRPPRTSTPQPSNVRNNTSSASATSTSNPSSTSTNFQSPFPPPPRKPLSRANLSLFFSNHTKPISYTDTTSLVSTSSPNPPRGASAIPPGVSTDTSKIRDISWSPLGTLIATAAAPLLRVWNPERPNVKYSTELRPPASTAIPPGARHPPPQGHIVEIARVAWNPMKEAELSSAGQDSTLRLWDVRARGGLVGEVPLGGEAYSLAWHTEGNDIAVGRRDDLLMQIDRRKMEVVNTEQQSQQTNGTRFSNNGEFLLLTTAKGDVRVLKWPSLELATTIQSHSHLLNLTIDPRGRHIALGSTIPYIAIFSTSSLVQTHSFGGFSGPLRSVSFSFDGSFLTGGSEDGTGIPIWHVSSKEKVAELETRAPSACVQWHPHRYHVAYSGDSSGLRIVSAIGG